MSNNEDHNLLTFLKKNSLFTNSPTKNGLRRSSKSRSKDKKTESKQTPTKTKDVYFDDSYNRNKQFTQPVEIHFNSQQPQSFQSYAPTQVNNTKVGSGFNETRFNTLEEL
jgi:hypothetical protein